MRSGEFVRLLDTTFDTVRHYEELGLLYPNRENGQRRYSEKDVQAFQAVREFKELGMTLDEIRVMFELKITQGCGSDHLLAAVMDQFAAKVLECETRIVEWTDRRDRMNSVLMEIRRVTNR